MKDQQASNYNRIAEAINYIQTNFKEQPDLNAIAKKVHLSPFHFQRLFTEWAGVSPKKFLQYISLDYAKILLKENQSTLFDAAHQTGLSGTSRLHDLFINIEGMSPGEYKNGGENLLINYSYSESYFGDILIASTPKGICHLMFADNKAMALEDLRHNFPQAKYNQMSDKMQQNALILFKQDWDKLKEIKLHLKGTEFQLKVWEALLKIPPGRLTTYGRLATQISKPAASRAVGTAIGDNPVAFIIPCHRVIQSSGALGGYAWGSTRKKSMIGWEGAQVHNNERYIEVSNVPENYEFRNLNV